MTTRTFFDKPKSGDWNNVAPVISRIPAEFLSLNGKYSFYDPSLIDTHAASGGYNSVFEISPKCCLRVFDYSLGLNPFTIVIPGSELQAFLSSQPFLKSLQ